MLDKTVFHECPLIGSYVIEYSPPSMVLGFFVADIGLPGWMDRIELFKKQRLGVTPGGNGLRFRPVGLTYGHRAAQCAASRKITGSSIAVTSGRSDAMPLRSGIYIVPTDRWYIERTVWLIAGCVLLVATALALLFHPLWILGVVATGLASIAVSLTGFCLVGNLLARIGFTPRLARPGWAPGDLYFVQTDSWYLERRIYLAVGINLTVASVLSLVLSPWWLLFTGFVGGAMVWFAATGFCIMANGLYWLGAEPRLAPLCEAAAGVDSAAARRAPA